MHVVTCGPRRWELRYDLTPGMIDSFMVGNAVVAVCNLYLRVRQYETPFILLASFKKALLKTHAEHQAAVSAKA